MSVIQCAVITAYKGINELDSLLEALHSEMKCFVHIDKKSKNVFDPLQEKYPDVDFYSEYSV